MYWGIMMDYDKLEDWKTIFDIDGIGVFCMAHLFNCQSYDINGYEWENPPFFLNSMAW